MQAGKLRHLIDIQQRTLTADAYGGRDRDWNEASPFATVYAAIEPLSGAEQWRAKQAQSSVSHKVTIRYLAGVNPKMRVKFGSRYLNIESVQNLGERNRTLELLCTEQT